MTVIFPAQPALPTAASRARSALRGLGMFFRRAPLSAFWGCIAAAIVAHGDRRPRHRALRAAEIRFPLDAEAARRKALVRHRPDRPRHAEPRHLRQPRLAHRGVRRRAVRHHGRRAVGPGLRLFRRPLRHDQPAPDRVPAILPRPHIGDGDRHGAGRRPGHGDRGHRHHAHPVRRAASSARSCCRSRKSSMSRRRAGSAPRTGG